MTFLKYNGDREYELGNHGYDSDNIVQLIEPPVAQRQCTFDAMRYLNNKLRNAQPNSSMKLMIVGPANSGKTTLAHRIVKDFNFSLNESTKGLSFSDILLLFNSCV